MRFSPKFITRPSRTEAMVLSGIRFCAPLFNPTTSCDRPPAMDWGLDIIPVLLGRSYAGSCIRTSQNSTSRDCLKKAKGSLDHGSSWISEGAKRPNKALWVRSRRLTVLAWASLTNFKTVSLEIVWKVPIGLDLEYSE